MRIFVDAMGGDNAPQAPVEGTIEALRRYPQIEVTLAGVIPEIEKYLVNCDDVRSRITLLDAPDIDNIVHVKSRQKLASGERVTVRIDRAAEYELEATLIRKEQS